MRTRMVKLPRLRVRILMIAVALLGGLLVLERERRQDGAIHRGDLIDIEVPSALAGHPITGERLVRPDGKISLGYYGEVAVDGMSIVETKVRVAEHLTRYLSDGDLGLVSTLLGADGRRSVRRIDPGETEGVSVRVLTKNSPPVGFTGRFMQRVRWTLGWP